MRTGAHLTLVLQRKTSRASKGNETWVFHIRIGALGEWVKVIGILLDLPTSLRQLRNVRGKWLIMRMTKWQGKSIQSCGENKKIEAHGTCKMTTKEAWSKKRRRSRRAKCGDELQACTACTQIICDSAASARFSLPLRVGEWVAGSKLINELKIGAIGMPMV